MLSCSLLLLAIGKTGTVRIHLTDMHNRPIARHEIWLTETNSTKLVRPFGVQWSIPAGPHHGVTNRNGDVFIAGVPQHKPMMVVTRFGPRFDAFVEKHDTPVGSVDVMKFEGAVYAGRKAHIFLANDREISGTVTDAAGKPMVGVDIVLTDTTFGHMGGYPGTTLDLQKSDSRGFYRFAKLPNCAFNFFAIGPKGTAVQARFGNGPVELISTADMGTSASALTTRAKTICNFQIIRTAKVTVTFKGTPAELSGWTASMSSGKTDLGGQLLDFNDRSATFTREALPGPVTIWISAEAGRVQFVAKKLTVKPGETHTMAISMVEVLKRRQRN